MIKPLLAVSLVGALSLVFLVAMLTSKPAGYFGDVEAAFSPDRRWILPAGGCVLYLVLLATLFRIRKRVPEAVDPQPIFRRKGEWIATVIGFEAIFPFFNLLLMTSHLGFVFIGLHWVIAGTAFLFLLGAKLLGLRVNFAAGLMVALILSLGALSGHFLGYSIFSSI